MIPVNVKCEESLLTVAFTKQARREADTPRDVAAAEVF